MQTAFEPPADYYLSDPELKGVCDSAASDVQALLKKQLSNGSSTTSLWKQLKGTEAEKRDLSRLPLLASLPQQPGVFSFQQASPGWEPAGHGHSDNDLGDEDDLEVEECPSFDMGSGAGDCLSCPGRCEMCLKPFSSQSCMIADSVALLNYHIFTY